jgi:tRNA 2-thiouridine synthesizing protein C
VAGTNTKSLLLLIRHSPYGSSLARASIDVALAAAAFDQAVSLLFVGDGVLQLLPEHQTEQQGVRNLGKLLASLPLYDIEQVYVDAQGAARHQLDLNTTVVTAKALDSEAMSRLLLTHDHLLGF